MDIVHFYLFVFRKIYPEKLVKYSIWYILLQIEINNMIQAYHSETSEFTSDFCGVRFAQSLVSCVVLCKHCLFCFVLFI
jgi:hypothetical protein